nr:hypothetical protein [Brevundimonas vancanneytii]
MDAQIKLAQAIQRNEVHAVDQPAQFLAQVLAGVALDRQVQVLGQAAVGLRDAGVQAHGLSRCDLGEEPGQLHLLSLQGRGASLQGLEVDHFFHEHDLGPFQASGDLRQLLLHRRALALDHTPVFLGRLLIARHRQGDGLRRDQMRLHAVQDAAFDRARRYDLAVGAGAAVPVGAADVLAAVQDHGRAAPVALHQPGQQPLGLTRVGRGKGGERRLAVLNAGPKVIVDDAQVRDRLADPVFRRVQHRGAAAGIRVLAEFPPVEHAHAGIEFLVQNSVLGAAVSIDGRWSPRAAARPGHAGGVQAVGDGSGRFPFGVTLKNRAHHPGLVRVDRQFALGGQVVPKAPTAAAEAVFDARDKAAASFVAELGQEHLVHRALQADVEFGHVPL